MEKSGNESTKIPLSPQACSMRMKKPIRNLVLFFIVSLALPVGHESWAQSAASESRTGLRSGQVTGRQGTGIQIDGKNYKLAPDVTIKDNEGNTRDISAFLEGTAIQFHVRRDQIDQLILILPR